MDSLSIKVNRGVKITDHKLIFGELMFIKGNVVLSGLMIEIIPKSMFRMQ